MLETLYIQGFKCFDSVEIALRRINVFSGTNSSGKSSAIQAFLSFGKRHVYYLPANRIGPEDLYLKNFDRVNFLGNKAEFIIDFLYKNR